jgi:hypothetical protein
MLRAACSTALNNMAISLSKNKPIRSAFRNILFSIGLEQTISSALASCNGSWLCHIENWEYPIFNYYYLPPSEAALRKLVIHLVQVSIGTMLGFLASIGWGTKEFSPGLPPGSHMMLSFTSALRPVAQEYTIFGIDKTGQNGGMITGRILAPGIRSSN